LFPHKEKVELHTASSHNHTAMNSKRKLLANGLWPDAMNKDVRGGRSCNEVPTSVLTETVNRSEAELKLVVLNHLCSVHRYKVVANVQFVR